MTLAPPPMTLALYGLAAVLFLVSSVSYFYGRFGLAYLTGMVYWACAGAVVLRTMGTAVALVTLVPLCFLPALFLFVHTIDSRTGTFIFPTMYSIPVAYLTGALLLVAAGAGMWL